MDVEPLTIFQQLSIIKKSEKDLKEYFKYELYPILIELFTNEGMHKGLDQSSIQLFTPLHQNISELEPTHLLEVVDWGFVTTL